MTAYYYVDSTVGSATGNGGRYTTKQTGSFATLGAAGVYASIAAALAATTPPVAGDFILLSTSHADTGSTFAPASGTIFESVSSTACDTYTKGASITTTGTTSLQWNGGCYAKGIIFTAGSSGSASFLGASTVGGLTQVYNDCTIIVGGTGVGATVQYGRNATAAGSIICTTKMVYKFSNAAQSVQPYNVTLYEENLSIDATSTALTSGFYSSLAGRQTKIISVGPDFTNLGAAASLVKVGSGPTFVVFHNAKTPTSWTGSLTTGTISADERAEMYNYDSSTANYQMWIEDYCGTIRTNTATYLTSGVSDGTTSISWKVVTNANASIANCGLIGPDLAVLYSTTGSKTYTMELLTDGTLNTSDIGLMTDQLLSASYPLSTMVTTIPDPLAGGSSLTAGAGTSAWTGYATGTSGLTTPTSSKLTASPTIAMKGYMTTRFTVMKPSITLYVNPARS